MEWIDLSALQRWLFDHPGKEVAVAVFTLDCHPTVGKLEIAELAKRFTETSAKLQTAALKKDLVTAPHAQGI